MSFSDHFLSRVILSVRLPVPPLTFYNYDFFLRTTGHISTKTCNETLFGKWDTKDKSCFFFKMAMPCFKARYLRMIENFGIFFKNLLFNECLSRIAETSVEAPLVTVNSSLFLVMIPNDRLGHQLWIKFVHGDIEKTTGQTIWLFLNYDSSDRVGPQCVRRVASNSYVRKY